MFDKIFYINLAHSTDRNENVINEIKKIKMLDNLERIDAVNGNKLEYKNIPSSLITDVGKFNAMDNTQRVYIPLTKGGMVAHYHIEKLTKR